MILYSSGGCSPLYNLFKVYGSVFPKASVFALPAGIVTSTFVYYVHSAGKITHFAEENSVMNNNSLWGSFSFLVGFLVIFRTSQSYSRFWEGCTEMHLMSSEWFDACSSVVAFTRHSKKPEHEILHFKNLLIRLFSMVHAAALGEIEDSGCLDMDYAEVSAFQMELIDVDSISGDTLVAVQESTAKTELILQWIQGLIVENIRTGILDVPPPILSRSFQEMATGMVHFHEAMKIANVPFPFPYSQSCDALLLMHWLCVPFIVSQWVHQPWWAGIFAFMQVFTLWSLNFIAIELENPFGADPNDLDGARLQKDMNNHLRLLLKPATQKTPSLKFQCKDYSEVDNIVLNHSITERALSLNADCCLSFQEYWEKLAGGVDFEVRPTRRFVAPVLKRYNSNGVLAPLRVTGIIGHHSRMSGGVSRRGSMDPGSQRGSLDWRPTAKGKGSVQEGVMMDPTASMSSLATIQSKMATQPKDLVNHNVGKLSPRMPSRTSIGKPQNLVGNDDVSRVNSCQSMGSIEEALSRVDSGVSLGGKLEPVMETESCELGEHGGVPSVADLNMSRQSYRIQVTDLSNQVPASASNHGVATDDRPCLSVQQALGQVVRRPPSMTAEATPEGRGLSPGRVLSPTSQEAQLQARHLLTNPDLPPRADQFAVPWDVQVGSNTHSSNAQVSGGPSDVSARTSTAQRLLESSA